MASVAAKHRIHIVLTRSQLSAPATLPCGALVGIVIPRIAPVISGTTIQVNTVAGTRTEGDTRFTVDLTSRFNDWYRDSANLQYGSEFRLRIPFTLANGDYAVIDTLTGNAVKHRRHVEQRNREEVNPSRMLKS